MQSWPNYISAALRLFQNQWVNASDDVTEPGGKREMESGFLENMLWVEQ